MTRARSSRRLWLAALVMCSAFVAVVPASAQGLGDGTYRAQLTVTDLTTSLGSGSLPDVTDPLAAELPADDLNARVLVENTGRAPLDAVQLVVEVHPAIEDRSDLTNAFDGELDTPPTHVHTHDVADGSSILPEGIRGLEEHFDGEELGWTEQPAGIHPVRFALLRGTQLLDDVVTAVMWLPERPETTLAASLVWPLTAAPWRSVGGSYPVGVDHELEPGARLDTLLAAAENTTARVVLAPTAHLLEDLSDRADGYEATEDGPDGTLVRRDVTAEDPSAAIATSTLRRFRELAASQRHPIITGAYANADLAALLDGPPPLRELAATAAADGRRRVQVHLGTTLDAATHLVGGRIDAPVLDILPGDLLLLPSETAGVGGGELATQPVRQLTAPSGRLLTAVVADPAVEAAFEASERDTSPVTAVQRILAEMAAAVLIDEAPTTASMLLLPPPRFDPSPQTANLLLNELHSATWLELGTPTSIVHPPTAPSSETELTAPSAAFDEPYTARLTSALGALDAATASSADEAGRIGGRDAADLRDDLLRSTSRWHEGADAQEATALVAEVQRHLDAAFGEISVASGSVTLTSDAGQVPITLRRTEGEPIMVRVTLDSPGGLRWPEGRASEIILLEGDASQTVTFTAQALSTGTFPVSVTVTDPTGSQQLTRASISVRSTAFSGVALLGVAVVVVGLLLFGALRRRRSTPPDPDLRLVTASGSAHGHAPYES